MGPGCVWLGFALARPGEDFLVLVEEDADLDDVAVVNARVPVFPELGVAAWQVPPHVDHAACDSVQRDFMALSGQAIHGQHGLLHRVLRIDEYIWSGIDHLEDSRARVAAHQLHGDALVG